MPEVTSKLKSGVWLNFPLSTLVAFMEHTEHRLRGHVLVLGPLAFCIVWRKPVLSAGKGVNHA